MLHVSKGLVTNWEGGGYKTGGGGALEVLPLQRGWCGKRFSHAEGGQKSVGVVFMG